MHDMQRGTPATVTTSKVVKFLVKQTQILDLLENDLNIHSNAFNFQQWGGVIALYILTSD